MTHVAIIGGGPAGLSTALLTVEHGLETTVFDAGESSMYHARLSNCLGIDTPDSERFVEQARRRARDRGVDYRSEAVVGVEPHGSEFTVITDEVDCAADYVVLATGRSRVLAGDLQCDRQRDGTVVVDRDGATSVAGAYAVGEIARGQRVLPVIAAGDGAATALAILARETGNEALYDFETTNDGDVVGDPNESNEPDKPYDPNEPSDCDPSRGFDTRRRTAPVSRIV